MTQISPMLAVSGGHDAIDFYKTTFGAHLLWHLGSVGNVVAVLIGRNEPDFVVPEELGRVFVLTHLVPAEQSFDDPARVSKYTQRVKAKSASHAARSMTFIAISSSLQGSGRRQRAVLTRRDRCLRDSTGTSCFSWRICLATTSPPLLYTV
jgi:hypothetical protein